MKKKIINIVRLSIENKDNKKLELSLGKVSKAEALLLNSLLATDMTGCEKIIDSYMIRHALAAHGFEQIEAKRGQIAITPDDFTLLPEILSKPQKIALTGKNNMGEDLLKYECLIGKVYFVITAVRKSKRGNKLVFTTMYKKK